MCDTESSIVYLEFNVGGALKAPVDCSIWRYSFGMHVPRSCARPILRHPNQGGLMHRFDHGTKV